MIEFNRLESPRLSLRQVATEFNVHPKTVYGWCNPLDHLKRPKPFLKSFKFGGKRYTTREHLAEFGVDGPSMSTPSAVDSPPVLKTAPVPPPPAPNTKPASAGNDAGSLPPRKLSRFEQRQIAAAKQLQDRYGIKVNP